MNGVPYMRVNSVCYSGEEKKLLKLSEECGDERCLEEYKMSEVGAYRPIKCAQPCCGVPQPQAT